MRRRRVVLLMILGLSGLALAPADAANAIQTASVVVDPPTLRCLGFSVPIQTGDDNYNAAAAIEYRQQGTDSWRTGHPLLRVRPETTSTEDPPSGYGLPYPSEQFAGSIFGLAPDTAYEIRITIIDPDGGGSVTTFTARTRAEPVVTPANPRSVPVSTKAQLDSALQAAQPGDVITLAAGVYAGSIVVTRSGTSTDPIIVRGLNRSNVIVDASGSPYGVNVSGANVYIEDLTVRGSDWGARVANTQGVVIRRSRFTSVNKGIDATTGTNRNFLFSDNILEGKAVWPDVSSATWDLEGIAVGGQGHVISHNTISGFGDALGLTHNNAIPNVSIDFYGNEVLWTGDDGIELDFAHRNVRVFNNRITNAGMGVSMQPVWGGPVYVFRNVLVNIVHSPYKLNNEPSGLYILNNTSVRTTGPGNYGGYAWPQLGYQQADGHWAYVANFHFVNNIVIGVLAPAQFTSALRLPTIDYNGWAPDGPFRFFDTWSNLADLKSRSPYEAHGQILSSPTFASGFTLPAGYATMQPPRDMTLHPTSTAVDAGVALPNITDEFVGAGPDLGAWERGAPLPSYGARSTVPPSPPTDLKVR